MKVGNLRGSCKDEVGAIVAFQKTLETGERLYDKGERDLLVATCYSYFGHYLCGLKHRGRGWREEFHDFGKGLQMLRQSYALSQDLGNAHLQLHGLRNLARAESNAGNTAEARDYFEKAALLFEETWCHSKRDRFRLLHRDSYLHMEISHGWQRVLLDVQEPGQALLAADRTRARALALLLQEKGQSISTFCGDWNLSWQHIESLVKEIGSAILFYSLLEGRCFIWVISSQGVLRWRVVDTVDALEGQPGGFSEFLLRSRSAMGIGFRGDPPKSEDSDGQEAWEDHGENRMKPETLRTLERRRKHMAETDAKLRRCYDLLYKPVAEWLKGEQHVYICPDRDLWMVPFSAMLDESRRYLIEVHTLVLMPSIHITRSLCAAQTALRVQADSSSSVLIGVSEFNMPPAVDGEILAPLPAVKDENTKIGQTCQQAGCKVVKVLDGEATLTNIQQAVCGTHRFLHFGTHGLLDQKALALHGELNKPESGLLRAVTQREETPEQMAWWVLAVPSWLQGPRALWLLCGKYQINPL
ncbi:unnamed protein product [Durusdinium trenchii]|uniref:CHAT domain-containing protein n=2 Tax=Durusdinium trenchii TaxID=1381693 RepID=A0ABP0MZF9_9DINO